MPPNQSDGGEQNQLGEHQGQSPASNVTPLLTPPKGDDPRSQSYEAANFSSLIAAKSLTSPPTRFVA